MPEYSKKSKQNLAEAHRDLQVIFNEVIKLYDCSILCGHRDKQKQNELFSKGLSKVKYPNSNHNKKPSDAVDAVPYPIDWNDKLRLYHFAGFVLGTAERLLKEGKISRKLRWGGDWNRNNIFNDQKFNDLDHFELI